MENNEQDQEIKTDSFFDENAAFYGKTKFPKYGNYTWEFISKKNNYNKSLLDIGGGSGIFSSFIKDKCNELDVTVVDPSKKLLEALDDERITKQWGQLPDKLNIPHSKIFDYILLLEVLHHVTGDSPSSSREEALRSLKNIRQLMDKNSYLIVHELFYESYLYSPFTRNLIFYLLRLQNYLGIKFLPKEFIMGLNVCFYTRYELEEIFNICGFCIVDSYEEDWKNNIKKKLLFLKKWGRIIYVAKLIDK